MKLLFVHHSCPGQFNAVLSAARKAPHQCVFITRPGQADVPGVAIATYATRTPSHWTHPDAQVFEAAMRRAEAVAQVASGLRASGFVPDLIIGHEGWGETLNLADIWPATPQIGFREYFYHEDGADVGCDPEFPVAPAQRSGVRAKNAVGLLALAAGHGGVTPTRWQRSLYPGWAQPDIRLVPDCVDLAACAPDPSARSAPFRLGPIALAPTDRLVTFVARSLEPYRGFHTLMRAVPRLLAMPGLHIACVGADSVSYGLPPPFGTWRARLLAELPPGLDRSRLHFPGVLPYADHLRLLRRSDVHAYLSYPFIASWSLREALACGCAVVASDTAPARELVQHGQTGVFVPPLDPAALADQVLTLLDDPHRRHALGQAARAWAGAHLTLDAHLAAWQRAIDAALAPLPPNRSPIPSPFQGGVGGGGG